MKNQTAVLALIGAGLLTHATQADVVTSYDAGVSPTAGMTGAADPTSQGWTAVGTASAFSHGLDSSNGGWRITDGTANFPFYYQSSISGADAATMVAQGWNATWAVAVNHDAINSGGGGVDNYYTTARQNNNAFWIEVAGDFIYVLTFGVDANDDITISDGTTTYAVTTDNNRLSEEIGIGAPLADYVNFTLSYDANTGDATLTDDQGNNHGVIAQSTLQAPTTDRAIFGAFSSGGQGSTTWNRIEVVAVPEPATLSLALIGLGGLLTTRRRRA